MATMNPFDVLGDDAEDPAQQLIAAQQQKVAVAAKKVSSQTQSKQVTSAASVQQNSKPASLPSKPLPPALAVREAKSEPGRGGGREGVRGVERGFGRGRGSAGFSREAPSMENSFNNSGVQSGHMLEEGGTRKPLERRGGYTGVRGDYRGGRRGDFSNGEVNDDGRPRRTFERRSGTGRGNEIKRAGAGSGNWGTQSDDIAQVTEEVNNGPEKSWSNENPTNEKDGADGNKESPAIESEEKEPEDKEMTLEEYEKVLEEKRKALQMLKTEERKVDTKEFESMQPLSRKQDEGIFVKLGSEKDKRKESLEKEEKTKKVVSINEFLKPAEGERFYPSGRGRGRGRGSRGYGGSFTNTAPSIEDPGQFPTLGGK